jgi:hypothetical protein
MVSSCGAVVVTVLEVDAAGRRDGVSVGCEDADVGSTVSWWCYVCPVIVRILAGSAVGDLAPDVFGVTRRG